MSVNIVVTIVKLASDARAHSQGKACWIPGTELKKYKNKESVRTDNVSYIKISKK